MKVITAVGLVAAGAVGLAGSLVFLTGQGLDRAEKWISIVGVAASVVIGITGLLLGWLTWRQGQAGTGPRLVSAAGVGAVAIDGQNRGEASTDVSGIAAPPAGIPPAGRGVRASGTGSVAVGGSNTAPIHTKVNGGGGSGPTS
jgi:hypothetical protein